MNPNISSHVPPSTGMQTTVTDIMSVSVLSRIPDFWADQPRVWFIRTEAVLAPQKLGDDARFDLVVSKLPKDVITSLSDFLARPPDTKKYDALKSKLLTLYEDSKTRQIEKLIGEMELGDQKPSQLLHRMRNLARDKIPDDTLRVLWQGHLPTTVRAVLAVTETSELDRLAEVADNVAEASRVGQVSEVSRPSTSSDTALIMAEIAKLSVRMMNLERSRPRHNNWSRHRRQRSRSASSHRSTSTNRGQREPSAGRLCFYHRKFQDKAYKCLQPCAWKPTSQPEN